MGNNYNAGNKSNRARAAELHTKEMEELFCTEIANSTKYTIRFDRKFWTDSNIVNDNNITMEFIEKDTVSALFDHKDKSGRVAILNFASYKHPGGGFIVGSKAQEESLCHESFLYNVLKRFDDSYYLYNRHHLNDGLYTNRALYSHDIHFLRNGDEAICDVLTCASPNFSVAKNNRTLEDNNCVLKERIRFILEIVKLKKSDTFIAGAFGCGVFSQDPWTVAQLFKDEAKKVFYDYKIHLVFAVPTTQNNTKNSEPFKIMVNMWNKKSNEQS